MYGGASNQTALTSCLSVPDVCLSVISAPLFLSYLLYCACKKLNSSLILSIDSPMVSLKGEGCPPWPPPPGACEVERDKKECD